MSGADELARTAAREARVDVRTLSDLDALHRVEGLFEGIWHFAPGKAPVNAEMMRALTKAGCYVAGAYRDEVMVGACVAFFGAPSAATMHSHVAGVAGGARHAGVGRALKLHQRAWALARGLRSITWTFDPLVARNAWFNTARLGAVPTEYLTDFYGVMDDEVNALDASDRLLVTWELDHPRTLDALSPSAAGSGARAGDLSALRAAGALDRLRADEHGRPLVLEPGGPSGALGAAGDPGPPSAGGTWLVAVPPDVEALRRTDPSAAPAWRTAVRETLGGALAAGARVRAFAREGAYVLDAPPAADTGSATPGTTRTGTTQTGTTRTPSTAGAPS